MSIVTTTEVERASDQQLQQEVAQPTGALGPAYVVVGEILKRKQMREGAPQKKMPRSTVKEDVARGLNAMPQAAMSAAGRDVMSQMPPQMMPPMMPSPQMPPQQMPPQQGMADGGIVAFRNGGLTAAEEMGLLGGELTLKDIPRTIPSGTGRQRITNPKYQEALEYLQKQRTEVGDLRPVTDSTFMGIQPASSIGVRDPNTRKFLSPTEPLIADTASSPTKSLLTPKELEAYTKRSGAEDREEYESKFKDLQKFATDFPAYQLGDAAMRGETGKEDNQIITDPVVTGDKKKDQKEIDLFGNKQNNLIPDKQYSDALKELGDFSFSTDDQIGEARKKAAEKYKNDREDPFKVFESAINDARKERDNIKKNNLNDALINAGAAILQAPGGQGLQWLGKGLGALQKKFEEGRSMLRDANKELRTSQIAKAQAEELRLKGEEAAADKAEVKMRAADERRRKITENNVAKFAGIAQYRLNIFEAETNRIKSNNANKILQTQIQQQGSQIQSAKRLADMIAEAKQTWQMMSGSEQKRTGFKTADEYATNTVSNLVGSTGGGGFNLTGVSSGVTNNEIPFTPDLGNLMRNQLKPD